MQKCHPCEFQPHHQNKQIDHMTMYGHFKTRSSSYSQPFLPPLAGLPVGSTARIFLQVPNEVPNGSKFQVPGSTRWFQVQSTWWYQIVPSTKFLVVPGAPPLVTKVFFCRCPPSALARVLTDAARCAVFKIIHSIVIRHTSLIVLLLGGLCNTYYAYPSHMC